MIISEFTKPRSPHQSKNITPAGKTKAARDDNQGRDTILEAPGREAEVFGQIAEQVKEAVSSLSIPIIWGGSWLTFKDWGHFELPWDKYP